MFSLVLLAIVAYAATNIDNLFVLLAFLTEAGAERRRVIAGQYAGSLILVAAALLLAALLARLPTGYVGLLGFLPIGVGLSKAWERFGPARAQREDNGAEPDAGEPAAHAPAARHSPAPAGRGSSSWAVASVAIANGSDNLAVYVPLYASHGVGENALVSLVFVVMIGLWCAGAVWLVEHPLLGAPVRRYGSALLPPILLAIGVSTIVHNDTLHVVFGL
ncbi:cadmium transporter [Paraburkholderia sp. Ac-20336]|uniref:cadmium resistance transporter n=1 Tax=Burkholderiaceae TaxID=119060 RepID=UPI00141F1959|nr:MULTISPECIES: cadmium resistance transporter [Burkholderiaceae]MBN3803135.1 cadmium transporter [Paraburkholderia sp. Ac-20336]MBN3846891.1 cadmium transporter [Paraburkholderia sp. Ac-20342]NIF53814.1 cadmium transporter [Burkholderia sp. Ax-1724]